MSALDRWAERRRRVAKEAQKEARQEAARRGEQGTGGQGTGEGGTGERKGAASDAADASGEDVLARNRAAAEAIDLGALGPGSDMSAFLREGVPDLLRRRALKALWRSSPVFANVDRLCDYDEDFRDPARVLHTFQSAWQAGRGYVFPEKGAAGGEGEGETPVPDDGGTDGDGTDVKVHAVRVTAESVGLPDLSDDLGTLPTELASVRQPEPSGDDARAPEASEPASVAVPDGASAPTSPASTASTSTSPAPAGASSLRARLGL